MGDPVLLADWHPVASSAALTPGKVVGTRLLGQDLALWRAEDGTLAAWEDRCPHRGTRFSIGTIESNALVCAYHGWRFDITGRVTQVPSLAGFVSPAKAKAFAVVDRYGLVWVRLAEGAEAPPPFPECDDPRLRKVVCGPYEVASSGPRIVENFLDMAHFAYVHGGILGDRSRPEIPDYTVADWTDESGHKGILATQCFAWQPQTNTLAHGGSDVEYTYRIVRPLTAILTKVPQAQADFHEAISLHIQPAGEEASIVWIILAMTNFVQSEDELRSFQDTIFLQDKPIVENQVPLRLPLAPGAETPVSADRMSQAYRRYLRDLGLTYGVVRA